MGRHKKKIFGFLYSRKENVVVSADTGIIEPHTWPGWWYSINFFASVLVSCIRPTTSFLIFLSKKRIIE